MAWTFILEDLAGNALSELPGAYEKTVVPEPVNTFATAGFKVPLDHADADFLLDGDALIRVEESDVPGALGTVTRFHGRLTSAEEVAGGNDHSVAVTAADGFWTLLRRLVGKSGQGFAPAVAVGTVAYTPAQVIKRLVEIANLESASGVVIGNTYLSAATPGAPSYGPWYYQPIGEKIAELSASLDGPDFKVRALGDVVPGSRLPAPTGLAAVVHAGNPPGGGTSTYPNLTQVTYAVTAYDANGVESALSPSVVGVNNTGGVAYFTISFNPVVGAAGYRLYRLAITDATNVVGVTPGYRDYGPNLGDNDYGGLAFGGAYLPPADTGLWGGVFYSALDVMPWIDVPGAHVGIGSTRLDSAFEYGDGLFNVESYKRAVSLEGTINRAYNLPPGFPDNATSSVFVADDVPSQQARGLLEGVVPADLTVDDLRTRLLAHHIAVRKGPRQVITFQPVRGVGDRGLRYGVDYSAGDVVPFRASVLKRSGLVKRIDALVRIYQVSMSIDNVGNATPTLTVTPN